MSISYESLGWLFRIVGYMCRVVLIGLVGLLATTSFARSPNVVLILADDFGRELLSSYGGQSNYSTPHLDALARTGMRFETCYATPLCVPSRVELLTGRYSFRNYLAWERMDRSQVTFPQLLKKAGYQTAMAGKWHPHGQWDLEPVPPTHAGYDEYLSYDSVAMGEQARRGEGNRFWGGTVWRNGKQETLDRYGPDAYSDFLVDFIRKRRDRPFLVYYAMTTMHRPFQPTADHPSAPRPGKAPPASWMGSKGAPENFEPMLQYADKMVGKLMRVIEELGLSENTLFVFTADNGTDNVGEAKTIRSRFLDQSVRGGKYFPTELGVNVPLLARWPGVIESGSVCSEIVDFTDILPTICDLGNVSLPENYPLDGRSLLPILRGQKGTPKTVAYTWGNYENNSSKYKDPSNNTDSLLDVARGPCFKFYSDGRLFNVEEDPLEQSPIAEGVSPQADSARKELKEALEAFRQSLPRKW